MAWSDDRQVPGVVLNSSGQSLTMTVITTTPRTFQLLLVTLYQHKYQRLCLAHVMQTRNSFYTYVNDHTSNK